MPHATPLLFPAGISVPHLHPSFPPAPSSFHVALEGVFPKENCLPPNCTFRKVPPTVLSLLRDSQIPTPATHFSTRSLEPSPTPANPPLLCLPQGLCTACRPPSWRLASSLSSLEALSLGSLPCPPSPHQASPQPWVHPLRPLRPYARRQPASRSICHQPPGPRQRYLGSQLCPNAPGGQQFLLPGRGPPSWETPPHPCHGPGHPPYWPRPTQMCLLATPPTSYPAGPLAWPDPCFPNPRMAPGLGPFCSPLFLPHTPTPFLVVCPLPPLSFSLSSRSQLNALSSWKPSLNSPVSN